jgi:exodeoxyribonuclease VIII
MKIDPGVYPGVPFDVYASWEAINSSVLHHFGKTPAHAYAKMVGADEESASAQLGRLVHVAALEPELVASEYAVRPNVDGRTKEGKAILADFRDRADGKIVVPQKDIDTARGIIRSLQQHPTAREAMYGSGVNELSLVWEDKDTGVLCKGRIDRLTAIGGWPFVVDVKTYGKPATRWAFQRTVLDYGYHEQAAMYLTGLDALKPLPEGAGFRKFAWLVCETEPPYAVRVFDAEDEALRIGLENVKRHLQIYAECQKTGVWPGWEEGLETCGLPAFAYKSMEAEP